MIVSESFIQSSKARDIEFNPNDGTSNIGLLCHVINDTIHQVTVSGSLSNYANHKKHFLSSHVISAGDRPLVVQFAASNAKDFADTAELVAPFADGVDLNCGCPQRYEGEASVEFVRTSLVLRRQKEGSQLVPFPDPYPAFSCLQYRHVFPYWVGAWERGQISVWNCIYIKKLFSCCR